jgi:putative transposase
MCRALRVQRSGYYAWLKQPESVRAIEDRRLLGLIKQSWLESGCVYGYRKIFDDLRELGECCGRSRVERITRQNGIQAQVGYKRPKAFKGGTPSVVAPNHLERQFDVLRPDEAWVTDITMVRTYEGWLYVAVVLDLFSRQVIGWSMQSRMEADLVVRALLMAVWRRQPKSEVLVHSDQGSQYTGYDWQDFLKSHNLVSSMSRRGNCHDNAVAESFFQLLKRERIKRRIYPDRQAARADIFDYIEMFYNRQRKHGYNDMLSPVEYERRYFMKLASV